MAALEKKWRNIMFQRVDEIIGLFNVFSPFPLVKKEALDEFFVNTYEARGTNAIERISMALLYAKNPYMKILFMGHRGSGKTTELSLLSDKISQEFEVISFRIEDEIDAGTMTYIDFIFAITSQLVKYLDSNKKIKIKTADIEALYDYWDKEKIVEETENAALEGTSEFEAKLSILKSILLKCGGILKTGAETKITVRKKIEPKVGFLIQLLNNLIAKIDEQLVDVEKKRLIFIIEDLDKLDSGTARGLFVDYRKVIFSIQARMILTFPIFMAYDENYNMIKEDVDMCQMLSIIKVVHKDKNKYEKGIDTLKEIVFKRADSKLFSSEALEFMIMKSGGAIRDLFQMISEAAYEALVNKHTCLELSDAQCAYRRLKSEYERIIRTEEDVKKLVTVYRDPRSLTSDNTLMSLLRRGAVIEYNGERWCGIHPAVEDFLKEKGVISD